MIVLYDDVDAAVVIAIVVVVIGKTTQSSFTMEAEYSSVDQVICRSRFVRRRCLSLGIREVSTVLSRCGGVDSCDGDDDDAIITEATASSSSVTSTIMSTPLFEHSSVISPSRLPSSGGDLHILLRHMEVVRMEFGKPHPFTILLVNSNHGRLFVDD
jgi:hypothetical protein